MQICYQPIGIIHSPYLKPEGTPIQPRTAGGVSGTVEIFDQYVEGLQDLEGFSHIILIYHFHLARPGSLKVKPFRPEAERSVRHQGSFPTQSYWSFGGKTTESREQSPFYPGIRYTGWNSSFRY